MFDVVVIAAVDILAYDSITPLKEGGTGEKWSNL